MNVCVRACVRACMCVCVYEYECLCGSDMGMGMYVHMCMSQLQQFTISIQALKVLVNIASEGTETRNCVLKHGMVPALMKFVHSLALHTVCNCV